MNNKDLKGHKVAVLHKTEGGALAVGKTFSFPSGAAYTVQASGAVISAHPKLIKGKAAKKAAKRARAAELKEGQR